jgi:hypothetical protein
VTPSEFAFLALGLLLGVTSGAALIVVLRARPPAARQIRVTVAPNSIPRRATTLADSMVDGGGAATRSPADPQWFNQESPLGDDPTQRRVVPPAPRTPVPTGPAANASFRLAGALAGSSVGLGSARPSVGIMINREPDPMVAALRAPVAVGATRASAAAGASTTAATAIAEGDRQSVEGGSPASEASSSATTTADPTDTGSCAEERRMADERCAVAARAREGAKTALDSLRASQRGYDDHASRAEAEAAAADPRAVRAAKEAAQSAFRNARSTGKTRDAVEAAARDWLAEINRINQATRESAARAEKHRAAASQIVVGLERLAVEADAARISAESAEEACTAAREAAAACKEAAAIEAAGGAPPARPVPAGVPLSEDGDENGATPMASRASEDAAIIRVLRGDNEVFTRIVAQLAGDDVAERRRWQLLLGGLVEALVARAIEAAAFDFPTEHPFWGPFTRSQCRDIAAALSSLGYRHDGFGGWAEDHIPSQRDLSLAVGYAGLDPMRIRHWPADGEMQDLLREVKVAADEYVWEAAGALTLGELVSLLGRRADSLAELWNEWGSIRPLLLAAD